jgi:hypothetical protein
LGDSLFYIPVALPCGHIWWYPQDRRLAGSLQSRNGHCWKETVLILRFSEWFCWRIRCCVMWWCVVGASVVHALKELRFFETFWSACPTAPWYVSENLTLQEGNFCSCQKSPCF